MRCELITEEEWIDYSPRAPPLKQNPMIQYSKPYNTVLINVVGHGMATGPEETGRNQPFFFFQQWLTEDVCR